MLERSLDSPVPVPVYGTAQEALRGGKALEAQRALLPGDLAKVFLGPVPEDKLPGDAREGRVLVGRVTYGTNAGNGCPASYPLTFLVPPAKPKKGGNGGDKGVEEAPPGPREQHRLSLRDAQVKLLRELKLDSDEARELHASLLEELTAAHPGHLPLLLEGLARAQETKDPARVVAAADRLVGVVDQVALAQEVARKCDEEGPDAAKRRRERDEQKAALVEALAAKCGALLDQPEAGDLEATWGDLRRWTDTSADTKCLLLHARMQRRKGRLSEAVRALDKLLGDDPARREAALLRIEVLKELGFAHWAAVEQAKEDLRKGAAYQPI